MSRSTTLRASSIRRSAALGAVAIAATLSACQDDAPSPLAPVTHAFAAKGGTSGKPGSGETVLFSGFKDGNFDIFSMNPDGSNVMRLTTDTTDDVYPDFARDNRKFVWARTGAGGIGELYTANADGSKPTPLTNLGMVVMEPRYSPDGTKVAFVAFSTDNGKHDVYTINADGTGLKRLTYETSGEFSPTWSPDGSQIAFQSDRSGIPSIYVMNADGLNVRFLDACDGEPCRGPAWSPDGAWIAMSVAEVKIRAFHLERRFSVPVGPIIADRASRYPAWSKDGTQVLFASTRGLEGTYEIYTGTPGTLDPTTVRRLTLFSPGFATTPAYSH
jgi:Tol biopolymer transport system component